MAWTRRHWATAAGNVLLLLVYAAFAFAHAMSLRDRPRLSVGLLLAFETLVVFFLLQRRDPDAVWHSWQTWLTTLGGTFAPLLLRPVAGASDLLAGEVLQVVGCALQVAAILSLNRSFGLLPAHRQIKREGLYRVVRHPLYCAYTVTQIGYVLDNPALWNLVVLVAAAGFQVLRILDEERFLLRYPAYAAYSRSTRWRLVPLVW
ncbi:MAG: isoprenylcysteine carboxyl methyltransferase [Rhodospirillaceae bacterium]|nr:isoprenylcysteine carboxyl methyltransferase [Rhodospirillaceae bacterium]